MRRRFGRSRRRGTGDGGTSVDAQRGLERIVEAGLVPVEALEPANREDIPAEFAILGTGGSEDQPMVVGFAVADGGNAALATLALAQQLADQNGFGGLALAVAPQWSIAARRRLALVGDVPFQFRAVAASALADGDNLVEPEAGAEPPVVAAEQVAERFDSTGEPGLFGRARAAFEGLAAKHGGAVRGYGNGVELVLLARCVAVLRDDEGGGVMETRLPDRSSARLSSSGLATAMDRLEGALRKRLNDRRVRSSEEGLRAQLAIKLAGIDGLESTRLWPLGGSDVDVIDLVGIDSERRPVVGAVRSQLTLLALGSILDAALALRPALAGLLGPTVPIRSGPPRLLLAARDFDDSVLRVLATLTLECSLYDVQARRGREPDLVLREGVAATVKSRDEGIRAPAPDRPRTGDRGRNRGGRKHRGPEAQTDPPPDKPPQRRFEEISLFDMDDDTGPRAAPSGADATGPRRRRGRSRRRGRRGSGDANTGTGGGGPRAPADEGEADLETSPPKERAQTQSAIRPDPVASDGEVLVDAEDLAETLTPLDGDVPEIGETLETGYEEDEPAAEADTEPGPDRDEAGGPSRIATAEPAVVEPRRPPRRRAAYVAHADRTSVIAAVLLARDLRLVEGFWVYPQDELMTFFRGVATDLREGTPIHLVGFAPSHDALQASALYGDRLSWFDHHEWPPEDIERLIQLAGADNVHIDCGAGSSLPAVLAGRTRRSRFSDKLVELVTGCFSEHDFERWGRVWWHQLTEIAGRTGEQRAAVDPLLAGRPSDLAREAAKRPTPIEPPEVDFVSQRDFRLVHFGGYTMVVVPTPADLDVHFVARVARERYRAEMSLSLIDGNGDSGGSELIVLGGNEVRGRRGFDLGRMVDHLASKHDWIQRLPNADRVARMRVVGLSRLEDRLDEVIREIAMGRSILEG
ncbi:MAG: hypothetical protein V3T07_00340 [Myxococcota bacterium]